MERMTGKKAKVEGEDTHIWGLQLWNKYGKWEVTVKERRVADRK